MYDFPVDYNSIDKSDILNNHKCLMTKNNSSLARVTKVSDRTKYLSLNDELCMISPTLIDLNPVELKYYPFMISLDKCSGSCNVLSPKKCVPKETKDINVKVFNMITNKNEAKEMTKHISCDCKCKFNSTPCNLNQKWNNRTCQCECKNYRKCKKNCSWNPSTCIYENDKYSKIIIDDSKIVCDEIISVKDIVSTKRTNTIATNVSINPDGKKVRHKIDCFILHAVLLVIILLLILTIICYHYGKHRPKQKSIDGLTI